MPEFTATAWLVIGLGLIVAEIFTLTLVLLFFGLSALLVAGIKLFGLNNLSYELILFAIFGASSILIFRRRFQSSIASPSEASTEIDRDKVVTLESDLAANGGEGVVQYQGVSWTAVNPGDAELPRGARVRIVSTEGIKLIVALVK